MNECRHCRSVIDAERERILSKLNWVENADAIETSEGWEEGWTPRMIKLISIFKEIVNDTWFDKKPDTSLTEAKDE